MNNILSRLHTPKSSENCDKFSKSVSYETLVGGTTTTGRDNRQIRRLFLSSADKPLSAVGTLTSLLCNSAKVVESLLQTLPVVRLVKVFSLLVVLSVGMISESKAESTCPDEEIKCGPNCCYSVDSNNNLNIRALTKTDNGYDINDGKASVDTGQFSTEFGHTEVYNDVIFNGDFDTIGQEAFRSREMTRDNNQTHGVISGQVIFNGSVNVIDYVAFGDNLLNSFEIPEGVTRIGSYAFAYNNMQQITIPDSVTSIGEYAFWDNRLMKSVVLTDSITEIGSYAFDNGQDIVCMGDNCENVRKLLLDSNGYIGYIGNFSLAKKEQCTGNYYWNGKVCKKAGEDGERSCAEGFVSYKNDCLDEYPFAKKRWTPAEANEWLNDGNDNFVVITFKK